MNINDTKEILETVLCIACFVIFAWVMWLICGVFGYVS